MLAREIIFCLCGICVLYAYLGYPLALAAIAKVRKREPQTGPAPKSVSIIVAARNEQACIGRRIRELHDALISTGFDGEVFVVSDGSEDGTLQIAREQAELLSGPVPIRIIALAKNGGKAAALTTACASASKQIIVFADARQTWAPDTLSRLLKNFTDPTVGGVSGELVVESSPGVMKGVGLYWRYEKWIRRQESAVYSMIGATGALSAVRRELFRPIPQGTILDDVYWPLQVAMQGFRVVHDEKAVTFDRLPAKTSDEFRRKMRTLSGNFQLVARVPASLLPWRNPIWIQFISHKLLRLIVPWALLGLWVLSAAIPEPICRAAFWCQSVAYGIALVGMTRHGAKVKVASTAASFVVLNAAAWVAFWVWISGQSVRSWGKVTYQSSTPSPLPALGDGL